MNTQLDFFQTRCREYGLRVTPQRIAIYEELCRSGNHPTAEQVHSMIGQRFPTISFNTVNQTLLTFTRINLADIVEGFGSPRRYDPNLEAHHHVHCTQCGKILDVYSPSLDRIEVPSNIKRDYEIVRSKVVLAGKCADCRRNGSRPK